MSWAVGFDTNWNRDVGYGVPAYCDHPDCNEEIDRGLSYVCGSEPFGGDFGCGLYFCGEHRYAGGFIMELCERCRDSEEPFTPKPDHPSWIAHKATGPSWAEWREEQQEGGKNG